MTNKKRAIMTEGLFLNIKTLLNAGVTVKQLVSLGTASPATISRVHQVETYEGYKELISKSNVKRPRRQEVHLPLDTPNYDPLQELLKTVQQQGEMIKRIDERITWVFFSDDKPKNNKRRFF